MAFDEIGGLALLLERWSPQLIEEGYVHRVSDPLGEIEHLKKDGMLTRRIRIRPDSAPGR